jgi:hypothetical protein
MAEQSEREAAYFTLLRARDELSGLERYHDYLLSELRRLRRSAQEDEALRATVLERYRRILRGSDDELATTFERLMALIDAELLLLPARIEAAAEYVRECEQLVEMLGGR